MKTTPLTYNSIVFTSDKRFGRVQHIRSVGPDSWLVLILFANGAVEEYHSDLLSIPGLRLVAA